MSFAHSATGMPPVCAAMKRDIEALKGESPIQRQSEDHYNNLPVKAMLVVEYVTGAGLKFLDRPQVFPGDFLGRFCPMRSYPYYGEADISGKRYYVVKDHFGVWLGFQFSDPV